MMRYKNTLVGITSDMLNGFFVDWPNPPNSQTHLKLLTNSSKVVIALDDHTKQVVGFITAISDGVLSPTFRFLKYCQRIKIKESARN